MSLVQVWPERSARAGWLEAAGRAAWVQSISPKARSSPWTAAMPTGFAAPARTCLFAAARSRSHLIRIRRFHFGWHLFPILRNRVVTKSARERVAEHEPLQAQPQPARHAASFNRFVGVTRTRGLKAATSREQHG